MNGSEHDKLMQRCIDLALCAEGMSYPNPMVGSVIVHDGKIIGEGYHLHAGLPHAEVNAINSVNDKVKLKESILYVNLEPCSHFGKTPPCADLIISCGIPKVVIGTKDTSRKVNGDGIKRLRAAGVEVTAGVLENESRWVNRRFFSYIEKKRPWIILKWAQSTDGFLDRFRKESLDQRPAWISGKCERILVHRWRSFEQAILAGGGTVRIDNPLLNVREWAGHSPVRIILSSSGRLPVSPVNEKQIVFTHNVSAGAGTETGTLISLLDSTRQSCFQIAEYLYEAGIQSLFIEGGASVLNHFIVNDLWDEARVFTGFEKFNNGIKAPLLRGESSGTQNFSESTLQMYLNGAVKGFVI